MQGGETRRKMSQDKNQSIFMNPTFLVEEQKKAANYSLLVFKPLENGYGHTLGNALRRVLLSSLSGSAITSVVLDGVDHQFSSIDGVKEDLIEILLNLKLVRVRADQFGSGIARLEASGPSSVTAADIECEAGFEIVNPDQPLFTITGKQKIHLEMKIESGVGYQAGEKLSEKKEIGELLVDAIFSPVLTVSYKVESTRVGRRTDYDKLLLDLKTDGTITPMEALEKAAKILARQFTQIIDPKEIPEEEPTEEISPEEAEVLRLTVEELDLPTRIANSLRKGGFRTVGDLSQTTKEVVEKVKNIGEKSAGIVEEALLKKGVTLKN
ncbi:MAG TPA: DNA-directed RNA polymerase subunit alpha [Bacteroidetes bacterium]|nr:DNA-directed RNA polymerase subunit alpha [Bacteroidota bacterium]